MGAVAYNTVSRAGVSTFSVDHQADEPFNLELRLRVPAALPFRRLYVAALVWEEVTTGYVALQPIDGLRVTVSATMGGASRGRWDFSGRTSSVFPSRIVGLGPRLLSDFDARQNEIAFALTQADNVAVACLPRTFRLEADEVVLKVSGAVFQDLDRHHELHLAVESANVPFPS